MNKLISYIIVIIGLLAFAISYPALRTLVKLSSIGIPDTLLMVIGAILLIVGLFLVFKSSSSQPKEVPIYEGRGKQRKIVGIQRIGK